jgi:hypothetical protein
VGAIRDSVRIPAAGVRLEADVVVPPSTPRVVGFVHGSGSSHHSPRHRYVPAELQAAGLATVLADLLTPIEGVEDARSTELRFDIDLLAARTALPRCTSRRCSSWVRGTRSCCSSTRKR